MNDLPILLPVCYLGTPAYFKLLLEAPSVTFEMEEHFVKQSCRTRCSIYGANGPLSLTVPVRRKGRERTKMKNVRIANDTSWQKQHWKSLFSAYRSSPYFEFYEESLAPFYQKRYEFLTDFNLEIQQKVLELLEEDRKFQFTSDYEKNPEGALDHRTKPPTMEEVGISPYMQVFEEKYGFLPDLSIVDLLFNLGPESLSHIQHSVPQNDGLS